MFSEVVKRWIWVIGLFLAVFVLSAGTYWEVLKDPTQVLAFNDGNIEGALSPMFRFPDAIWRIWDNQTFFGMGGRQSPLTIAALGESIGPEFWRRGGPALILGLSALAFFWMLRQYRMSRPAAALAAAFLAGTGACHNFAVAGLSARPVAMACTALALGFIERGRCTGRWLPYAIGGGCLGLGISEVPDVGVIYALTTAVVFWWTHLFLKPETGNLKPESGKVKAETKVAATEAIVNRQPSVFSLLGKFTLYVLFSGLLAWQTISVVFATNIRGVTQGEAEAPASRYAWATQWSIPPEEMWNAVSGSYFGRSMRSEEFPYWGRLGRDANWEQTHQGFRNFTMTGWHLGVVPCIFLLALFIHLLIQKKSPQSGGGEKRRDLTTEYTKHTEVNEECDPWWCGALPPSRAFVWMVFSICVLAMLLMWGKYFPLYKLIWSLPYFGTIRNPEKWNGVLTLFMGIGVAVVLDALLKSLLAKIEMRPVVTTLWKILGWTAVGMAGLALLIALGTMVNHAGFVSARLAEDYGRQSEVMWNNALMACLKVALLAGLLAGGVWWVLSGRRHTPLVLAGLLGGTAVLMLGDQFLDNRTYVQGHHYQQYLAPNPLTDFLDAHRTEGRLKLLPPQHPLLNNLRLTLLMLKGYDLFDPVSVSRMPADYATLFQALEKQPIRLWGMGALRYFLTLPGAVDELNKLDNNRGRFVERLALGVAVVNDSYVPVSVTDPGQQALRLVEFSGAQPRYSLVPHATILPDTVAGDKEVLRRLTVPDFDPATEALVQSAQPLALPPVAADPTATVTVRHETPAEVDLEVTTARPVLLVRATKFDADWQARIDGQPACLLRVNYLLQGLLIPAGQHTVTLAYELNQQPLHTAIAARVLLLFLLGGWWWLNYRRRGNPAVTAITVTE